MEEKESHDYERDCLSDLPEDILASILSLLPTKQTVATTVLSKRWRYILQPNAFLVQLIDRGIREFSIFNKSIGFYELPSQAFFCLTLEILELKKCTLSLHPLPSTLNHLTNIKNLILIRVYISNYQFKQLTSSCRLLESLKVDGCVGVSHCMICAPTSLTLEKEGIDYTDIFAPVVKLNTIRTMMSIVAIEDLHLEQLDVKTIFLYGYLEEEIYMCRYGGYQEFEAAVIKEV
ncbi:FBD-associated F-box protein At4g10400-like [Asparagus officinalis]|uniref:FBD-associated F-box protein At4g10400-like n=1 Tax=Asparagus officinalis TaxID=4686 RepID=UPI00098DFF73|nr:FBD-associated F-box protein At4g10400-like [Asparagus officinalis]